MREVTAVVEAETKNSVARLNESEVHRHVCACTRVWLHVGVLCTKQLLHAVNRDRFNFINNCVATVVALAWVTLCVLVGENRTSCFHHVRRGEVFTGD
jgi:hypothetical protein